MKSIVALSVCCLALSLSACRKDKKTLIEQLPPATQTGAGTMGFIVDNKAYNLNYPYCRASYLHLGPPLGDGYFLAVTAQMNREDWMLGILTDSLKVETGGVYPLNNIIGTRGVAAGFFSIERYEYLSNIDLQGELRITKLDSIKDIVSGTFWFDGRDTSGNIVRVKEGRFDLRYTE